MKHLPLLKNDIITIYSKFLNESITGYVIGIGNKNIFIAGLNEYGKTERYILLRIKDIFRIESGTRYESYIQRIVEQKSAKKVVDLLFTNFNKKTIIQWIKEHNIIVTLYFSEKYKESGYIDDIDKTSMRLIDTCEKMNIEGECIFDLKKIKIIEINTVINDNKWVFNI